MEAMERAKLLTQNRDSAVKDRLGPSAKASTTGVNWGDAFSYIGQPWSATNVSLSKLYQMRCDPMIAFALQFIKVPLVRAPWFIECEDKQVQAFVDKALREIYTSLIFQMTNSLDFGYAPLIKNFQYANPDWMYVDPEDKTAEEHRVWPEGNVQAIIWKTFTQVAPEHAQPAWTKAGDFDGFKWSSGGSQSGASAVAFGTFDKSSEDVDILHALWFTNEKEKMFGSLFGYPRIAYAARYWWSYWFRWALADRAFEKHVDPGLLIYFPTEAYLDEAGNAVNMRDIALSLGESARSSSTVAVPHSMTTDADGKNGEKEWQFEQLKMDADFVALNDTFGYLDVMKLRCVTADTLVDAPRNLIRDPDGIAIKDLKPGQLIWTFNTDKRKFELNPVKMAARTMENQPVFKVNLSNGRSIRATGNHPFLTSDLRWVQTADLGPGDALLQFCTDIERYVKVDPPTWTEQVDSITVVSITADGTEDVWDVAIDTDDDACRNFIAGEVVLHNSVMVPEHALIEGSGGTSSRNVAAQMGDKFFESQYVLMSTIDEHINRFMIPQLVALNFPDREVTAKKVTRGFASVDIDLAKQIFQLLGQADPGSLRGVDIRELLGQYQIPMLSPTEEAQRAAEQSLVDQAGAAAAVTGMGSFPDPEAGATTADSTINPDNKPSNAKPGPGMALDPAAKTPTNETPKGGAPVPNKGLKASEDPFLHRLRTMHPDLDDDAFLEPTEALREAYESAYRESYEGIAMALEEIALSEEGDYEEINLGPITVSRKLLKHIGELSINAYAKLSKETLKYLMKVLLASGTRAAIRAGFDPKNLGNFEAATRYAEDRANELPKLLGGTTEEEVRIFLSNTLAKSTDPSLVAAEFRKHFDAFPVWKAERVARAEAVRANNMAQLLAAQELGLRRVRASDASAGFDTTTDAECKARNGKDFDLAEAAAITLSTHPSCTLKWTLIPLTHAQASENTTEKRPGLFARLFGKG